MLKEHVSDKTKVIAGLIKSANIVSSTFGGHGKNVLMYQNGNLTFTKDGVSVAQEIGFKNTEEHIGHLLLMNAAKQTVKECGDGTTLTSLLTSEFVSKISKELESITDFNAFIENADFQVSQLVDFLKQTSRQIESATDIYDVALTSCKDPRLAEMIKGIYVKAGLDASISVEQVEQPSTYIEHTTGLSFEEGFVNQGFANLDNGNCAFENPSFLLLDNALNEPNEINDYVVSCHKDQIPLVILCPNYSDLIVRYALSNKERGIKICLVKMPGWAESKKNNVKDIKAFLTNGSANKVLITPYEFTIFNNPTSKQIKTRVKQLQQLLESSEEEWERIEFRKRIANIQQKSAIIYVGGTTSKQAKEEFDRIEDAVGAVKSATSLGFQTGVGVSLYNYTNCDSWLAEILRSPHEKIMSNARLIPSGLPINTKTKQEDTSLIDPTLVLVSAIQNAYSLAKMITVTDYILYD